MFDENGNFIGPSKYGNSFQNYWGAPTLGAAMNQDVAFPGEVTPYTGPYPTSANLKSYGASAATASSPMGPSTQEYNFTQNPNTLTSSTPGPSSGAQGGSNGMLGAGSLALGGLQTIGGLIGLMTTKEPGKYGLTNDNKQAIGEAKSAAKFGLSGAQKSAFNQGVRQAANTDIYNAKNTAGSSLSRSVFGLRRGMTLGEMNRLAVNDFNIMQQKRQYRDQVIGREQEVKDRNTALDWNQYGQKMQAYGGALQSGLNNMAGFFNLGEALKYTAMLG